MAQAGLLGNSKEHLVLLLESLRLFLSFVFGLLVLFHSFIPNSHRFSSSILYGLLVGMLSKHSPRKCVTYTFTQAFLIYCKAHSGAGYRDA